MMGGRGGNIPAIFLYVGDGPLAFGARATGLEDARRTRVLEPPFSPRVRRKCRVPGRIPKNSLPIARLLKKSVFRVV